MVKPEIRRLIELKAAAYNLDPDQVEAHVMVESSGNPNATRFEPRFYERYVLPLNLGDHNEARGRSTSFGLLQIMGQVARELGYQGNWPGLMDPMTNLEYGCKKLAKCYKKYPGDAGIAAYNSGTPRKDGLEFMNQIYVDRVKDFLEKIKTQSGEKGR